MVHGVSRVIEDHVRKLVQDDQCLMGSCRSLLVHDHVDGFVATGEAEGRVRGQSISRDEFDGPTPLLAEALDQEGHVKRPSKLQISDEAPSHASQLATVHLPCPFLLGTLVDHRQPAS
ncbi:hypothetical protein LWC35_14635 [Pseudonocardia kujensis]|uniref:hypothetical protein n=1 Tax=Pseudonocardia kujensis TaxID=1128675 RepID=UPI001E3C414E|nr:hypothetical protein [Pseudonocardia kujensis]MCE0764138.1 hypothetical protein [Pseudonocardia kujensis]